MDYKEKQVLTDKAKLLAWGAVAGAIVWWVVLAFGFGWTSAGTTAKMVADSSEQAVQTVIEPFCVSQFLANEAAVAEFKKTAADNRDTVVRKFVKKVGDTEVSWDTSETCAKGVQDILTKSAEKKS